MIRISQREDSAFFALSSLFFLFIKATALTLLLIRMFTVGAIHESPLRTHINFGRELVFSADLCYNGANKKPLPLGEVAA